ncbi:hypothetical protein BP5796_09627 [Coleophoma crateriformis]|uniref:Uncharacterized protein n=1 Tax=Coleophoma crateriformis TaxID=565419 RepID=A0A3D8QYX2_9HELO|nr:hypothetical protein BP5796_09627 [Coleophoma crateriformis]
MEMEMDAGRQTDGGGSEQGRQAGRQAGRWRVRPQSLDLHHSPNSARQEVSCTAQPATELQHSRHAAAPPPSPYTRTASAYVLVRRPRRFLIGVRRAAAQSHRRGTAARALGPRPDWLAPALPADSGQGCGSPSSRQPIIPTPVALGSPSTSSPVSRARAARASRAEQSRAEESEARIIYSFAIMPCGPWATNRRPHTVLSPSSPPRGVTGPV